MKLVHDAITTSYTVDHKLREITLNTEFPYEPYKGHKTRIIFHNVVGYQFYHDAFGNIVHSIDELSIEAFLKRELPFMADAYRMSGAFGKWTASLEQARAYFDVSGVKVFGLSSSMGLDGWIIAEKVDFISSDA